MGLMPTKTVRIGPSFNETKYPVTLLGFFNGVESFCASSIVGAVIRRSVVGIFLICSVAHISWAFNSAFLATSTNWLQSQNPSSFPEYDLKTTSWPLNPFLRSAVSPSTSCTSRAETANSTASASFSTPETCFCTLESAASAASADTWARDAALAAPSADIFASPACLSASVNFAISYLCTALCASSSLAPYIHSPTTPATTKINPILVNRLTHLEWPELDSNSIIALSVEGKISASSLRASNSFFLRRDRFIQTMPSWISSTPSNATPMATIIVAHVTKVEKWSACVWHASLVEHPIESKNISDRLDRGLRDVVILR